MDGTQLSNAIYSKSAENDLYERVWQFEFYRAGKTCLPDGLFINVDVGHYFGSSGFLDFYIPQLCWSFELVRFNMKLEEHLDRFRKGGVYYELSHNVGNERETMDWGIYVNLKRFQWKVINFIPAGHPRKMNNGLWNVEYSEKFDKIWVFDDWDKMIGEFIYLKEEKKFVRK